MKMRRERSDPRLLDARELDELWAFFSRFVRRDRDAFELRLQREGELVRIRDDRGVLRGFVFNELLDIAFAGTRYGIFHSVYAAYDPTVRGANITQSEGLYALLRAKLKAPFKRFYWMFTASTFKSYLLLPRNFLSYWPRPDAEWPLCERSLIEEVMSDAGDPGWDPDAGLIRRNGASCYREGIVPLEPDALADPDVMFYARLNPGQREGDTLVCLAPLDAINVATMIGRMIKRVFSKSSRRASSSRRPSSGPAPSLPEDARASHLLGP
jgi:hypothetical protein